MTNPATLHQELSQRADRADVDLVWPSESWEIACRADVPAWAVPTEYGGGGLAGIELLRRYRDLSGACLTTCFILSQRDAACRRLLEGGNESLRRRFLPQLASGEQFATVGLSQLTTSRQHVRPPLAATPTSDGFVLDGVIPWVTGASRAENVVIGAVLEDRRQVMLLLPMDLPGLHVDPALDLMALRGSVTAEIRCAGVRVPGDLLLAGPAERVMNVARAGTGGLETSCLALGVADAAIAYIRTEAGARPILEPVAQRLAAKLARTWGELEKLAEHGGSTEAPIVLRAWANELVLQATQAALTVSKGTGFAHPHPAQRWARQALFFLVWSCPWPAAAATLDFLSDGPTACE
jgi:butyryl-CoA dehydrogenase